MALDSENSSQDMFGYDQYDQFEQSLEIGGASVVRRNARERNRVKQVNNGFSQLRQHIPVAVIADLSNGRRGIGPGANKKLSKVSTLRMAVEYIRRLQKVIDENDHKRQERQQHPSHHHVQQQQQHMLFQQQNLQLQHQQQQQQQQHLYALQQQLQLSSPTGSVSSCNSSDSNNSSNNSSSYYSAASATAAAAAMATLLQPTEVTTKLESSYEDYRNNSCSSGTEDEDILDYISLWQDDL